MNMKKWPRSVSWLMFLLLAGCGASKSFQTASPAANAGSAQGSGEVSRHQDQFTSPDWRREAWLRFSGSGRYRIARADEFRIPDAAKKNEYTRIDLEQAVERPYNTGDINRDNLYQDLAVIVVDTERDDDKRFGLIIFNEPADGKTVPESRWLFRESDLSKTTLSWWSGGLTVRSYREDGSYDLCYVNWKKQQQAFACEKEPK